MYTEGTRLKCQFAFVCPFAKREAEEGLINFVVHRNAANDSMVVLTVENTPSVQAMDSTVLVHAKRPEAWHSSKHEQMILLEMEKQKNKGKP